MKAHTTTMEDFFSQCYLQYFHSIRSYIAARIYFSDEADDLTQDVFVRLWEHQEFVNKDTVCSLLYTIARNLIVDKVRRYYKKEDFISYIYNVQEVGRNTVEENIFAGDLKKMHLQLVDKLPEKRRQVYKLSFSGLASSTIADQLNLSIRTVEGQLFMARKFVRTSIQQQLVG